MMYTPIHKQRSITDGENDAQLVDRHSSPGINICTTEIDLETHDALSDRLRKTIKLNDLFNKLISWWRENGVYATPCDIAAFYNQTRIEFGFTAQETRNIEVAVENLYFAEYGVARHRLISKRITPRRGPSGFWHRLCWLFLGRN